MLNRAQAEIRAWNVAAQWADALYNQATGSMMRSTTVSINQLHFLQLSKHGFPTDANPNHSIFRHQAEDPSGGL
jgi:hypothetical protein